MPSYPERAFLPHDVLAKIVSGTLQPRFPEVFSPEHLQPVGIDIAGQRFIDASGNRIESHDGKIFLQPGSYQVHFGFELPKELEGKLEPLIHWRTSNHRCGVLGGQCYALDYSNSNDPPSLFGAEIVGNYHVLNPHGVMLDKGARLAQLSLTTGYAPHLQVSDMKQPLKIETFSSSGQIGTTNTILPAMREPDSTHTGAGSIWKLDGGTPYLVTLKGPVAIAPDEVVLTSLHFADYILHPKTVWLSMSSALGDPGFKGILSVLIQPAWALDLSETDELCRFTRIPVLSIGKLREYEGQWKDEASGEPLVFTSLEEAGLTGVDSQPLEQLAERAFGR